MRTLLPKIKIKLLRLLKPLVQNYVPRRYILFIDSLLAFIALECSFFLINSVQGSTQVRFVLSWELAVMLGVQILSFILLKSYFGLVRFSSFRDVITQLKVTALAVFTILIINRIYYYYDAQKLILDAGVIVYGFISFSLLFFFRVLVKQIYKSIYPSKKNSVKAFIYGTDLKTLTTTEGLLSDHSEHFRIAGFIHSGKGALVNRIHNLPIYSLAELKQISKEASALIITEEKLKKLQLRRPHLVDELLELQLTIYKIAPPQNLEDRVDFKNLREVKIEDLLQRNPIKINNPKLKERYTGKTILVTGAAGSIGSEIVRQLIPFQPGHIILLDQAETPLHDISLELKNNHPHLSFSQVIANVRNQTRLAEVFSQYKPQVVFHGAAYKHVPMMENNPIEALSVNFCGTCNLADLALEYQVERFVFVSTDKAVNPTNIMGASKRSAEIYIQAQAKKQKQTTFIITRFGNVLGSNGSVIPHFKKQIAAGGPVTVTHPEITRYFMTIDEACQLVLEAGAMGKGGEIYVFDMGQPIKIINLAKQMIRLSGLVPNEDIAITYTGLRPGEKLYEELLADKETTLPTHHEKILIAEDTNYFNKTSGVILHKFSQHIISNDIHLAFATLKSLVPEYECRQQEEQLNKKQQVS